MTDVHKFFDVVVVGGGVIGLSLARELLSRNARVCVINDAAMLGRATTAAAGMLTPSFEQPPDLAKGATSISALKEKVSDFAFSSHALWPAYANTLEEQTGRDLDFQTCGTLGLAFTMAQKLYLGHLYEEARSRGCPAAYVSCEIPDVVAALTMPSQGQVDPRRLLSALRDDVMRYGGTIISQRVENLEREKNKVVYAHLADGMKVNAEKYCIATGALSNPFWFEESRSPFLAVKGQAFSVQNNDTRPLTSVLRGNGTYLCPKQDGRIIVGATEEHGVDTVGTDERDIKKLRQAAAKLYPPLLDLPEVERWSGLRPAAHDYAPVIGQSSMLDNFSYAAGHYRNGILLAPLTALTMADCLESKPSQWLDSFNPQRFL